jgi:hypothetical protein
MVKSADTADLKSADPNRSWGFKSPSGHQNIDLTVFLEVMAGAFGEGVPLDESNDVLAFEPAFRVLADTQAHVWEQRSQRRTELCEASTKPHFLSAALWWYLPAFVMPGIGECSPPVPEGPFPLNRSSRVQGL